MLTGWLMTMGSDGSRPSFSPASAFCAAKSRRPLELLLPGVPFCPGPFRRPVTSARTSPVMALSPSKTPLPVVATVSKAGAPSGFRLEAHEEQVAHAHEPLKTAGPERLFWGSDWPFAAFESKVTYQDTIDSFTAWVPDPVARRRIGGETALKFYFS